MLKKTFYSLIFFLMVCQAITSLGLLDSKIFPTPLGIFFNIYQNKAPLSYHAAHTLWRLVVGVLLAIAWAIPLAFFINKYEVMSRMVRPILACFYPIPKIAIYPFILLIFGTGDVPKIILIALGAFFLLFSTMANSLDRIKNSSLMEVVSVYQITGLKLYYHVFWKGVYFDFLYGLNLAIGYGLVMSVASEMSAANNGLGFYIWNSWDAYRILDMYAGLVVISALGLAFYFGIELLRIKLLNRSMI